MADIPDLIFTTDANGNVNYPNSGGGYSTGNGTGTGGYSNTTGKKWWEVALGVFPAILSSIFGNNQSQQPTTQYPYPTTGSTGVTLGGTNMMLIIVAVGLVVFLLLKKK